MEIARNEERNARKRCAKTREEDRPRTRADNTTMNNIIVVLAANNRRTLAIITSENHSLASRNAVEKSRDRQHVLF